MKIFTRIIRHSLFLSFWLSLLIIILIKTIEAIDYFEICSIVMLLIIILSLTAFFYLKSLQESFREDHTEYLVTENAKAETEDELSIKFRKSYQTKIRFGIIIHLFCLIIGIMLLLYHYEKTVANNVESMEKKIESIDSLSRDIIDSITTLRYDLIPMIQNTNIDSSSAKGNSP